jgi:hypothetical protein
MRHSDPNRIFLYTGKDVPKAVIKTVSGTFSFVYGGDVNVVSENDIARADILDQFEGSVLYSLLYAPGGSKSGRVPYILAPAIRHSMVELDGSTFCIGFVGPRDAMMVDDLVKWEVIRRQSAPRDIYRCYPRIVK